MPTQGWQQTVLPASATADFWRTSAGALPDGVTDPADAIQRTGLTGVGAIPATTPVAQFEVAFGARSGVDGRVVGVTPLYVTGNLPGLAGLQCTTPVGGIQFMHSNQTQGVGFSYNGIYAAGSNADQDLTFLNKGSGQYSLGWQTKNVGNVDYFNWYSCPVPIANSGFLQRWYQNGVDTAHQYVYNETVGPLSNRFQWDITGPAGGLVAAARLRPAQLCLPAATNNTELYVGENQVHARKIVLYDTGRGEFNHFGFGIQGSTLAYVIPGIVNFNRWYTQDTACPDTSHLIFSVSGQSVATVDPAGLNVSTTSQGVGELRFGSEGSNTFISSKRNAGGNQNGLDLGTGNLKAMSIGGVTNARHIRYNVFGQTADGIPAYINVSGSTGAALVQYDKNGTAGNDQRPILAVGLENCGAPCGQSIPDAIVLFNSNTTSNQQGILGFIAWKLGSGASPNGTAAFIGANRSGLLDLGTMVGGQVRLLPDNVATLTTRRVGALPGVNIPGIGVFATDALAGAGGLATGDLYRDVLGAVRIKL